jgi:hypothetical protein
MERKRIPRSHSPSFERLIKILIVDGVAEERDSYHGFLNSYKLYNITCVSTAQDAKPPKHQRYWCYLFNFCTMDQWYAHFR